MLKSMFMRFGRDRNGDSKRFFQHSGSSEGVGWKLIFIGALVFMGTASPSSTQDLEASIQKTKLEIAQAKKDLRKVENDVRKTDSLIQLEATQSAQSNERQIRDEERREKEMTALQARVQGARAKIASAQAATARKQRSIDEIKSRQHYLVLMLAGYCDSVIVRVEGGLPWEQEIRSSRVKSLKSDLEAGSASLEEGFARLSAVLKEEAKSGDEIAILNKPITRKNGEVINAQVLKIGNQYLMYMEEEAKYFGILERKETGGRPIWEWREDPSFSEKNEIRNAIEVKTAKRPPQLVTLNLLVAPVSTAKAMKGGRE